MKDGKEMTEFIKSYLNVDKITLLGHSWGSIYGANLVLAYPDCYNLFIGCGQLVDIVGNEEAFKKEAIKWAKNDEETLKLLEKVNPEDITPDSIEAKNKILKKYGYNIMKDGADYFLPAAILFNPNYSIKDWISYFKRDRHISIFFARMNLNRFH